MVDGRTWKRNGEEQEQSGEKTEVDLNTDEKSTKTEKIVSWKFRQVKQAKEGELL